MIGAALRAADPDFFAADEPLSSGACAKSADAKPRAIQNLPAVELMTFSIDGRGGNSVRSANAAASRHRASSTLARCGATHQRPVPIQKHGVAIELARHAISFANGKGTWGQRAAGQTFGNLIFRPQRLICT